MAKAKEPTNIVTVAAEVDLGGVLKAIADSKTLDDNDAIFRGLSSIVEVKAQLDKAAFALRDLEAQVKTAINDKAKELVGKDWQVIQGAGYKISRSWAGSKYDYDEEVADEKYLHLKISANSEVIDEYVKDNGKLPDGIELNPNRSEQIRITVKG